MTIRPLLPKERQLLEFLVGNSSIKDKEDIQEWLKECLCETLSDGGMGSVRIVGDFSDISKPVFSFSGAEAEFYDKDGVVVIVTLNISKDGFPFEMDFWKVNFEPLIEYPDPGVVKLIK